MSCFLVSALVQFSKWTKSTNKWAHLLDTHIHPRISSLPSSIDGELPLPLSISWFRALYLERRSSICDGWTQRNRWDYQAKPCPFQSHRDSTSAAGRCHKRWCLPLLGCDWKREHEHARYSRHSRINDGSPKLQRNWCLWIERQTCSLRPNLFHPVISPSNQKEPHCCRTGSHDTVDSHEHTHCTGIPKGQL